jgi:hypothetical protein
MASPAEVGDVDAPHKRQQTHRLPGARRIIAAQVVGECR